MGELWQQTSEMIWQRPLLWVPVLVADLLGFLVSLGSGALVQRDLRNHLQYLSALGGAAVKGQVTAAVVAHVTLTAMLLGWAANLLHLLVYAIALTVVAHLVRGYARDSRRFRGGKGFAGASVGGVLSLVFQAWVVYVVTSFLYGWATRSLVAHGHRAWLENGWLELGFGVVLVALLAFLLAPSAVGLLTRRMPPHPVSSQAQIFSFSLAAVSLLLARYVLFSVHSVHIAQPAVRYALELTGSWISALPYALMFTGLSLLALRSAAAEDADTTV